MPNPENIEKHKFNKGESGNPTGRPLGVRNRSTIVKEWLSVKKRTKNPLSEIEEELEIQDMMVLAMIGKALKGDVNAFKELMDSGFGKVKDVVDTNLNINKTVEGINNFYEMVKNEFTDKETTEGA